MKKLRQKLSERYLSLAGYAGRSFSFLLYFTVKEFEWIFLLFLLLMAGYFIPVPDKNVISKEYLAAILMLGFIKTYYSGMLLKKMVDTIEGKSSVTYRRSIQRIIVMYTSLSVVAASIIGLTLINENFIILIFVLVTFLFRTMYFWTLYFTRDITFREAMEYNFHLLNKNKLRMLIPMSSVFAFLMFSVLYSVNITNKYLEIAVVIGNQLISLYSIALYAVISLNVEYVDLKNAK